MSTNIHSNPFDIDAVATYGEALRGADDLEYMRNVMGKLDDYLRTFPDSGRRYGGALGLIGGHGSGKTHLLSRIAERARELASIRVTVVYAKADSSSMFDLYHQFLSDLSRDQIQDVIRRAQVQVAFGYLRRAKITEDVVTRLEGIDDLTDLYRQGTIDREHINRLLSDQLIEKLKAGSQLNPEPDDQKYLIPLEFPQMLLRVDDPAIGEAAYRWLQGEPVEGLRELGLEAPLKRAGVDDEGLSAADVAAINSLESIAALHQIADMPFVLLLDQLEVLLRANSDRVITLFSVIKKMIEQLGRQNGLMFIAGNEDSWSILPRDVGPRFREREPTRVGVLNIDETKIFLQSYTQALGVGILDTEIEKLRSLAGGNLREMIRIGHQAYEISGGSLDKVDAPMLEECALMSGTTEDRKKLALDIADKVLGEFGTSEQSIAPREGVRIERLLLRENRPYVGLLVMAATGQVSEVNSALSINAALVYLQQEMSQVAPVIISVGYSSNEIISMLSTTAPVIEFNELDFALKLRTQLVTIGMNSVVLSPIEAVADNEAFKLLRTISERLEALEIDRQFRAQDINISLEKSAQELARPAVEARSLKTRWELMEQLDELEEALATDRPLLERELIRSMLIANETYLKLDFFDVLGGEYLDNISEARYLELRGQSGEIDNGESQTDILSSHRSRILRDLRSELRRYRHESFFKRFLRRLFRPFGNL